MEFFFHENQINYRGRCIYLFEGAWKWTVAELEELKLYSKSCNDRKTVIKLQIYNFEKWKRNNVILGNRPVEFNETYMFTHKYHVGCYTSW